MVPDTVTALVVPTFLSANAPASPPRSIGGVTRELLKRSRAPLLLGH